MTEARWQRLWRCGYGELVVVDCGVLCERFIVINRLQQLQSTATPAACSSDDRGRTCCRACARAFKNGHRDLGWRDGGG